MAAAHRYVAAAHRYVAAAHRYVAAALTRESTGIVNFEFTKHFDSSLAVSTLNLTHRGVV